MTPRGRPTTDAPRTKRLLVSFTDAEYAEAAARAEAAGIPLARWIRERALRDDDRPAD